MGLLLKILVVAKKIVLFAPMLLGDGADVLGEQGFAQPMPTNMCPTLHVVQDCENPEMVSIWWAGGEKFRLETTSCWGADGPDDCTLRTTVARSSPTQIAASPQDIVQLIPLAGNDCRTHLASQVPFLGRSVAPEPSSGDDIVTEPFEAPDDYP